MRSASSGKPAAARSWTRPRRRIGRDPHALARISRESGVHVIMGAGFYVGAVHPEGHGRAERRRPGPGDNRRHRGGRRRQRHKGGHNRGGRMHLAPRANRAQVPAGGGGRPERDGRGDTGASGSRPGRAPGDTGAARGRRSRSIPCDHGTPGPDRLRVRRATRG